MMALLLSLIIAVAAFNIVATLVMVVTEKRGGIAILRTLGCSPRDVVTVFVLQGTALGWAGAVTGVLLGIWMSLNVATLEPKVQKMVERLGQEKRGKDANAEICDGTIALYKRLSYRKGETRGTLLRGMALQALKRDQIRRNIAGEDGDETA